VKSEQTYRRGAHTALFLGLERGDRLLWGLDELVEHLGVLGVLGVAIVAGCAIGALGCRHCDDCRLDAAGQPVVCDARRGVEEKRGQTVGRGEVGKRPTFCPLSAGPGSSVQPPRPGASGLFR